MLLVQTGCTRVPQPTALELEIDEDTTTEVTLSTTDSVRSNIYYHISTLPQHGSITNAPSTNNELIQSPTSGAQPVVSYTPETNYFGIDEFEYVIKNENGRLSKPATVKIVISAINDAPVAEPMLVTTAVDTAIMIQPQAIDVDGRIVQYEIVSSPNRGEVVHEGEMFRFTPQPNFLGDDSFEYVAIDDWGLRSAKALVTIRTSLMPQEEEVSIESPTDVQEPKHTGAVPAESTTTQTPNTITSTNTPGNTLPVAEDLEVLFLEDSRVQLELKATDSDGTIARYGITTLPAHGILSGAGSKRTYTPLPDFFGTDSFAYVAIDNQGGVSTPAIVSVSVDPVNDIPTVESSHWATVEDSPGSEDARSRRKRSV